jgi:hypothetical protein
MSDMALVREKRALDNDRLMTRRALNIQQNQIAMDLQNGMGQDMMDVLSGKIKVKLSFKERIRYKIKFFLKKIFKTF